MRLVVPALILACLAALPVSAGAADAAKPFGTLFNVGERRAPERVAELSAEEKAAFRQQWQNLPPKEREAVMRKLRQQWRNVPPEERQKQRGELLERMRGADGKANQTPEGGSERPDDGYGLGFEARQWERPETGGGGGGGFGRGRN